MLHRTYIVRSFVYVLFRSCTTLANGNKAVAAQKHSSTAPDTAATEVATESVMLASSHVCIL